MAKGDFTLKINEGDYRRINKALEKLENIEKSRIIQKGLSDGSSFLARAGKNAIKAKKLIKTKNLLSSTGKTVKKKKLYSKIGFKRPKGNIAHVADRGSTDRYTKRGFYRGKMPRSLFWTKTIETHGDTALNIVIDSIDDELNKL